MKLNKLRLVAVLTVFCLSAQAQDPVQVEKPEPKVGDTRIYAALEPISKVEQRTEELAVTEVSDSHIQMTDKVSSVVVTYDRDWAIKQVGSRNYSPSIRALAFPMQVGKKWEHSNSYVHDRCGNTTSDLKNEVVGWEEVTVPAGTFRALRIDSSGYWRNNCGSDRLEYKFWYVPKVKWLVKSESLTYAGGRLYDGQIRELKSYKVE